VGLTAEEWERFREKPDPEHEADSAEAIREMRAQRWYAAAGASEPPRESDSQ
jgi:hypothetical protein